MKTLFIPAKKKITADKRRILEASKKLPKNIAIVYSIQYETFLKEIRKILEKNHNITHISQVLGCSKPEIPNDTEALLLLSDGNFHSFSLAYETKLPIYILDNQLRKISGKELAFFKKRQKASYANFLNSKKAGILISLKSGQERLNRALKLSKELKKDSYLFLSNNINTAEFENFPQIESWINTACPRLDMDSNKIVNADKI